MCQQPRWDSALGTAQFRVSWGAGAGPPFWGQESSLAVWNRPSGGQDLTPSTPSKHVQLACCLIQLIWGDSWPQVTPTVLWPLQGWTQARGLGEGEAHFLHSQVADGSNSWAQTALGLDGAAANGVRSPAGLLA